MTEPKSKLRWLFLLPLAFLLGRFFRRVLHSPDLRHVRITVDFRGSPSEKILREGYESLTYFKWPATLQRFSCQSGAVLICVGSWRGGHVALHAMAGKMTVDGSGVRVKEVVEAFGRGLEWRARAKRVGWMESERMGRSDNPWRMEVREGGELSADGERWSTVGEYHESLVHVGMIASEDPARVALVGEGAVLATMKEVVKHPSLLCFDVLGVEESVVGFEEEHFPQWQECVDGKCSQDKYTGIHFHPGNAKDWFLQFEVDDEDKKVDVLIMDTFSFSSRPSTFNELLKNPDLVRAVNNSLSSDSIMILPLGKSPSSANNHFQSEIHRRVADLLEEEFNMQQYHVYEAFLPTPFTFFLACKLKSCDISFLQNPSQYNLDLHRLNAPTLLDGSSFHRFLSAPRQTESIYCSRVPLPMECDLLRQHQTMNHASLSSFSVKTSSIEGNAGRGVFADTFVPKHSVLGMETAILGIHFPPQTYHTLSSVLSSPLAGEAESVWGYMHGYGYEGDDPGGSYEDSYKEYFVDASINTFVNHGCNGTSNLGGITPYLCGKNPECTMLEESMTEEELRDYRTAEFDTHSPVILRHRGTFMTGFDVTLRDIHPGEELLHNYVYFESDIDDLIAEAGLLNEMCRGKSIGLIAEYEDFYEDQEYETYWDGKERRENVENGV